VDLLYGDHEGGQRTISRFSLTPHEEGTWFAAVARHWSLDRADPRQ
jgi:predicted cupin superfamily sugar epimerase